MLRDANGEERKGIGFVIDGTGDDFVEFKVGRKLSPEKWESVKKMFELLEDVIVGVADPATLNDLKLHS